MHESKKVQLKLISCGAGSRRKVSSHRVQVRSKLTCIREGEGGVQLLLWHGAANDQEPIFVPKHSYDVQCLENKYKGGGGRRCREGRLATVSAKMISGWRLSAAIMSCLGWTSRGLTFCVSGAAASWSWKRAMWLAGGWGTALRWLTGVSAGAFRRGTPTSGSSR